MRTLTGESLIDIAAIKVKEFVRRYEPQRLYVFFSGGKDSAAVLAAVAYAGDSVVKRAIIVYNELVGNTHPLNVRQAYNIIQKLGFEEPTVVESPPYSRIAVEVFRGVKVLHIRARSRRGDFWDAVEAWGLPVLRPGTGRRWCYNEFKEKHWRALPFELKNGKPSRFVVVGVKATDSHWRHARWVTLNPSSPRWERVFEWRDGSRRITDYALSPILKLTTDQVWSILGEAGLGKELVTYRLCGDSLNCVFCPLRSPEKQRRIIECVLKMNEGVEILQRAKTALLSLQRAKAPVTSKLREEWLKMLERINL